MPQINGLALITKTDSLGVVVNIPAIVVGVDNTYMQSKPLDLGAPDQIKHIQGVRLDLSASTIPTLLKLTLGWQTNLEDSITWGTSRQITSLNPFIPYRISGRYITFKLSDEIPTTKWLLTGIEFHGSAGGRRI